MVLTIGLPAKDPFDFAATLRFLAAFPATSGEQATDGGVLRRARAGGSRASESAAQPHCFSR
jgi:hypothetical protein